MYQQKRRAYSLLGLCGKTIIKITAKFLKAQNFPNTYKINSSQNYRKKYPSEQTTKKIKNSSL